MEHVTTFSDWPEGIEGFRKLVQEIHRAFADLQYTMEQSCWHRQLCLWGSLENASCNRATSAGATRVQAVTRQPSAIRPTAVNIASRRCPPHSRSAASMGGFAAVMLICCFWAMFI